MRTTVNIDEHLLAEAKVIAAGSHRSIGSVLEDALRALIAAKSQNSGTDEPYVLPSFTYDPPGLRPGVDLYDRDQIEELLDDGKHHVLP